VLEGALGPDSNGSSSARSRASLGMGLSCPPAGGESLATYLLGCFIT
jgi:hypothetical protein